MGKWTHSIICLAVTDRPFAVQICQRCTIDPKKENPYWPKGRCWLYSDPPCHRADTGRVEAVIKTPITLNYTMMVFLLENKMLPVIQDYYYLWVL